jgi:hypothetical protein
VAGWVSVSETGQRRPLFQFDSQFLTTISPPSGFSLIPNSWHTFRILGAKHVVPARSCLSLRFKQLAPMSFSIPRNRPSSSAIRGTACLTFCSLDMIICLNDRTIRIALLSTELGHDKSQSRHLSMMHNE